MTIGEETKYKFNNIQSLRGIAALLVCAYHFRTSIVDTTYGNFLFGNGWIGVQIFFMISGFIMVHTTSNLKNNFSKQSFKFLLNRVIRIVPLYFICTTVFISDQINDGILTHQLSHVIQSYLFIIPFMTNMGPDYGGPLLFVGWTLNYEMLFYLIFGLSILFGKHRYVVTLITLSALVVIIPQVFGFNLSGSYKVYNPYPINYLNALSNPILIHFIFGVLIALVLPKIKLNQSVSRMALPVSVGLFLLYYLDLLGIGFNAIYDLLFCGILLCSFLMNDYNKDGIQLPKPLIYLGDRSYSLYLWHPLVLAYLHVVFKKAGVYSLTNGLPFFLFSIAAAIFVSSISYQMIELKSTRFLKNLIFGNNSPNK